MANMCLADRKKTDQVFQLFGNVTQIHNSLVTWVLGEYHFG